MNVVFFTIFSAIVRCETVGCCNFYNIFSVQEAHDRGGTMNVVFFTTFSANVRRKTFGCCIFYNIFSVFEAHDCGNTHKCCIFYNIAGARVAQIRWMLYFLQDCQS
jgi:hypothetical protein